MGLLAWVVVLPAIAAMLAATDRPAELSIAHLCALASVCLLALLRSLGDAPFGWQLGRQSSPKAVESATIDLSCRQVNNSLFELHKPKGTPTMQVLFFHGLQCVDNSNAHVRTWRSEDGSLIWPREWLVEDFPGAHVFTVSYNEGVRNLDMFLVGENLTVDFMDGNIGQVPYCPVILVGYCVGGLVIKQICLQAQKKFHSGKASQSERKRLGMFLDNVKGVFYYGTPHHGSSLIANVGDGPLFKYFKVLNEEAARLNFEFDDLRASYPTWTFHGLGESLPTNSGHVIVPEAASREGDEFNVVEEANHNSICQPSNKVDRRFYALKNLLNDIASKMEEEAKMQEETRVCPQNFQHLPKEMISVDAQVQDIMAKLDNARILGLGGMGGLGKTTLVKAVFNELGSRFEYSCFVRDVKLIIGGIDAKKDAVCNQLHCHGKKVEGERNWSIVTGKKLLLVLDDISHHEEGVLLHLANGPGVESRFIVTSRDQELLKSLGEFYLVPFWNNNHAEVLFRKHAFPNLERPPQELARVMESVISKCDGLPLTLEVLGKYLRRKRNYEDWEQTLNALEKGEDVKNLNERLWATLRLSYNDLGWKEQQIFLDAATFFCTSTDWTLREAKAAWSVAYDTASERLLWEILVDMSLVYPIQDHEHIKVHGQLQSLGQRIALEPSNNGTYRVWDGQVGLKMLQSPSQLDAKGLHALRVGHPYDCWLYIPGAFLPKVKKSLQFFEVERQVIIGGAKEDGSSVPTEIVLLKCYGSTLLNPALQTRLVALKLYEFEDVPASIGLLSGLKHLELIKSEVRTLPNSFRQLKALQHLKFSRLSELESLPESFGQLSALNYLEFDICPSLHALPQSFGQLKALHRLRFESCYRLESLSKAFGELESLNYLELLFCNDLQTLPDSFGKLSALTELTIRCQNVRCLPESFGQLTRLQRLMLHADFERCPNSLGDLTGLRELKIGYYSATSIPDCIKSLPALDSVQLYFIRSPVEPLPAWLITSNVPNDTSQFSRMIF